jgi:hypothetical protein
MTAEQDPGEEQKKPIRFDFPTGTSADRIAKALNEARKRILAEKAEREKKAATEKPQSD